MLAKAWRQLARRSEDLAHFGSAVDNLTSLKTAAYFGNIEAIRVASTNLPKEVPQADRDLIAKRADHVDKARIAISGEAWSRL